MATFYLVATPLGNLKDITLRALEVLREVDLILAENIQHTKKLLHHYQIKTPLISYQQHSKISKLRYILELLKKGRNLALVCNAGTPGISDPGGKLIEFILEQSKLNKELFSLKIVPIPGPSALTAGISISGFPMDRFLFLGFLPSKKKRKKFLERIKNARESVIFFESPHRLIKTLKELNSLLPEREGVVCKELTKIYEKIFRGKVKELLELIEKEEKLKGEFTILLRGVSKKGI